MAFIRARIIQLKMSARFTTVLFLFFLFINDLAAQGEYARPKLSNPDSWTMIVWIVGIVVRVDPAHYLAAAAIDRIATKNERLLCSLRCILSGP